MAKCFKAGKGWVVDLTDNEWFGVSEAERERIVTDAREQASVEGCDSLSIFALADPIFPLYDHTGKKRVHAEQVRAVQLPITVFPTYRVEIFKPNWDTLSHRQQQLLIAKARDAANAHGDKIPGKYEIVVLTNEGSTVVEKGRV